MLLCGMRAQAAAAQTPTQNPSTALTPVSPKDVLGIWQGTLHITQANRDLRTELQIAQAAAGEYKVAFYSIDQGGRPLVATKTTFENGTLIFTMDLIGGRYERKMSPDGNTITGTWTQGPTSLPLNLARTEPDEVP
jgi:hypothetical protein